MKIRVMSVFNILIVVALSIATSTTQAKSEEFPGRAKYSNVPYITIGDLHKTKGKVIIVDVRTAYEYKTLHIKGALNISFTSNDYVAKIQQLRTKNMNKKIIVYCNGKTCMKSYKAVRKAKKHSIKDIISYDAGIMDWAKKYPSESVLLGKSPIDPKNLISKKIFKTYLIEPEKFENMIGSGNVIVLDMRDSLQRNASGFFLGKEQRVSMNDTASLNKYISKANKENKTLLIYDEVGKQIRWLHYQLQDKGAESYKFMKGGAKNYYKYLDKKYKY